MVLWSCLSVKMVLVKVLAYVAMGADRYAIGVYYASRLLHLAINHIYAFPPKLQKALFHTCTLCNIPYMYHSISTKI